MSISLQKAKVLFAYNAQAANQISLHAGQVINITSHGGPGGWSSGEEIGTGILHATISVYISQILTTLLIVAPNRENWLFPF